MPASSVSSGSWSGTGARPQDILDLDRYMRQGVRPPSSQQRTCEDLVVDGGGLPKPCDIVRQTSTSSEVSRHKSKTKRFSHDSGLSEDTYNRHKHRPHKRSYYPPAGQSRHRDRVNIPDRGSNHSTKSMRAFRHACEKALQKQQEQIAQICEKLTQKEEDRHGDAGKTEVPKSKGPEQRKPEYQSRKGSPDKIQNSPQATAQGPAKKKEPRSRSSVETSEITSSSRSSTYDNKKPLNRRTDECKTYKIIMSKLDELNRMFVVRGAAARRPAAHHSSADDVTVCDKLVATDFSPRVVAARVLTPTVQRNKPISPRVLVERGVGSEVSTNLVTSVRESNRASVRESSRGSGRVASTRHSTQANNSFQNRNMSYKILECHNRSNSRSTPKDNSARGDFISKSFINKQFDLNDPIKLYAQAKHMQTMYAATHNRRRSLSAHGSLSSQYAGRSLCSLCSLCRGYWHTFRELIGCPDGFH